MNVLASLIKLGGRKFAVIALAGGIAASGTMVWTASSAAFSGYTTNPNNSWGTGSVVLRDDDGGGTDPAAGTAMFTLTNLKPGDTSYRCIKVTNHASTSISGGKVRVWASAVSDPDIGATTDSLGDYIKLKIEEGGTDDEGAGTFSGANNTGCANWASITDPPTVIYSDVAGTLADFKAKTSYATGVPQAAEWTPAANKYRMYKITYTLSTSVPSGNADVSAADTFQGRTATIALRWESQVGS